MSINPLLLPPCQVVQVYFLWLDITILLLYNQCVPWICLSAFRLMDKYTTDAITQHWVLFSVVHCVERGQKKKRLFPHRFSVELSENLDYFSSVTFMDRANPFFFFFFARLFNLCHFHTFLLVSSFFFFSLKKLWPPQKIQFPLQQPR